MLKPTHLITTTLLLLTCDCALSQTAGEVFAGNCENGGGSQPGDLPIQIGSICVGTGPLGGEGLTVGRTTFNTPLSPIDNNSSGTVVTASKDTAVDVIEDRRNTVRKSSSDGRTDSESIQLSTTSGLLRKMSLFANMSKASGDRKNELIATEQVGSTENGQDTLNDPDTYIRPALRSQGFAYDITNVNAGIDFRLSRNLLLGLVLAYNKRTTDQVSSASYSKYKDTQLSLLFSYAMDSGFYADAVMSYGDGDQRYGREFSFTLNYVTEDGCFASEEQEEPCINENDVTLSPLALAKSDSKTVAFAASAGFEVALGGSTLTPFVKMESSQQTVDDYRESAQITNEKFQSIEQIFIDAFLLRVHQQNIESTSATLGLEYNRVIATDWGVVSPKISLASIHQLEDPQPIRASFLYNEQNAFLTETPSLDDQYWNIGLSTNMVIPGGFMFYALAEKLIDHRQLDQWSWAVGLRKELYN